MSEQRTIKRSFAELALEIKENLARQQKTVATDTKRLNVHGYVNEDVLLGDEFRNLESQIASLQLEGGDGRIGLIGATVVDADDRQGKSIVPGVSAISSDKITLWNALESEYDYLLKTLVNESLEDSMRVAICDLWEDDLRDWESCLVEYEKSLDTSWSWHNHTKGQHRSTGIESPGRSKVLTARTQSIITLTPHEKLLLNLLGKPPAERSLDLLSEIVKLSCESLGVDDQELRDTCAEIWDIIISLCGVRTKNGDGSGSTSIDLRNVSYNALRCLEDSCRRQLLHQLGVSQECVTGEELLDRLGQFCSLDGIPSFPDRPEHFWQLTYWCLRCGSLEALSVLLSRLSDFKFMFSPEELDILVTIGHLLHDKLHHTSRSLFADEDSVWHGEETRIAHSSNTREHHHVSLDDLLDRFNAIPVPMTDIHPTLPILVSVIQPDSPTVSLREYMPNATAEDFLWYNIHLATLRPLSALPQTFAKLQRRILEAGPKHFGSGINPNNLNFAKITTIALAPTAGIDWLLHERPELSILCLQWFVYLTQFGICGSNDSLIALFPDMHQFIGSTSIDSAFSEILLGNDHQPSLATSSLATALQWCELLPFKSRFGVISSILKSASLTMFNDSLLGTSLLESQILGSINEDGSGKGGLLYQILMSKSWDSTEREKEKKEAKKDFESLIASLAEQASDSGYLMSAVKLSYLIFQDRSCMKFLIKIFVDSEVFPSDKQPTSQQLERQREALKFFAIFEGRILSDELQDLKATFEILRIARKAAAVYQASSQGLLTEAWNFIIDTGTGADLFPHTGLVAQWKDSDLELHLPRLIDVCSRCLQSSLQSTQSVMSRDAGRLTIQSIRAKAEALLNSCTQLTHRGLSPGAETIRTLRELSRQ